MGAGVEKQPPLAPLVSIGCAVYNGRDTLRRALDGLVTQDYPNVELIICDDGSTDGSREICKEYAARYPMIRYVENDTNLGIVSNFNKLFGLSKGKYFLWADQDDVRDPTCISKCVAVLEEDEDAVLCHSYTTVFWQSFERVMHVNTLDRVDDESNVTKRYWRFLRTYSDTTIYGVIRSDALRKTALFRPDSGSSNALLFELLLLGKFRQVPEPLYFYSAAWPDRPSPEEEYRRASGGRQMPKHLKPFLVLALNQTKGVLSLSHGPLQKGLLLATLWSHVTMVNAAKAAFRLVEAARGGPAPKWFEEACAFAVADTRDIHFVVGPDEAEDYYRKCASLRRG